MNGNPHDQQLFYLAHDHSEHLECHGIGCIAVSGSDNVHAESTGASSHDFANSQIVVSTRTAVDAGATDDGVFYLEFPGSPGQTMEVKLQSGGNTVDVQATAPSGTTGILRTPPLMVTEAANTPLSFSGVQALQLVPGVPKVSIYLAGTSVASFTPVLKTAAFLGMALSAKDTKLANTNDPNGHLNALDHILGKKTSSYIFWSNPLGHLSYGSINPNPFRSDDTVIIDHKVYPDPADNPGQ